MNIQELSKSSEWGQYREEIIRLYGEEGWTLPDVSKRMRDEYGLKKTDRQYKRLFKIHKVSKNQTAKTWAVIHHRLLARRGKRSEVLLRGEKVPQARLDRNIKRYAHEDYSQANEVTLDHITVRTPSGIPEETDLNSDDFGSHDDEAAVTRVLRDHESPQGVPTPWDLVDFASPPQQRAWELESIELPEESMGVDDYGDIQVLSAKARELNLKDMQLFFNPGEEDAFIVSITQSPRQSQPKRVEQHWIPTSPFSPFIWESLLALLANFVSSKAGVQAQEVVYGCPKVANDLKEYSKSDLLNLLITIVLQKNAIEASPGGTEYTIHRFLSVPGPRQLLKRLLLAIDTPRARSFAMTLIAGLQLKKMKGFDMSEHTGVLFASFEALLVLGEGELSRDQIHTLYTSALEWPLPSLIPRLIARRKGTDLDPTDLRFGNYDVMSKPGARFPQTAALLLRHGEPAAPGLIWAVEEYIEASQSNKSCESKAMMILMLLSHGADPNVILESTIPLTIAEYGTSRCPSMGSLFRDWVEDPTSQEILKIYEDFLSATTLDMSSQMAREVVLLAITCRLPINLSLLEAALHNGAHPDLLSLCPRGDKTQAVGRTSNGKYFTIDELRPDKVRGDTTRRATFGLHSDFSRPIEIAFLAREGTAIVLLLQWGSSLPPQLSARKSSTWRPYSGVWQAKPSDKADSNILRKIADILHISGRLNLAIDSLVGFAVTQEDASLVRQLIANGLDLNQTIEFDVHSDKAWDRDNQCTPLLIALMKCSLGFVQKMWRMNPRFLDTPEQNPGAYELGNLCRKQPSECVDLLRKINFLLDLGADIESRHSSGHGPALTPLQTAVKTRLHPWKLGCAYCRANTCGGPLENEICEQLIQRGADVNASGSVGPSPLQLAAFYGSLTMLRFLLLRGAEPNDNRYNWPLCPDKSCHRAISSPLVMICGLFNCRCQQDAAGRQRPVIYHAGQDIYDQWDRSAILEDLLKAGADVDYVPEQGESALIEACRQGCFPTVKALISRGSKVSQRSKKGKTPLEVLCEDAQRSTVNIAFLLLDEGCDVSLQGIMDEALWQALRCRSKSAFQERAEYLKRTRDLIVDPGLTQGCREYPVARLQALVEAGADVNYKRSDGMTPLMNATQWCSFSAVLYLIENGADIEATDHRGETPFYVAIALNVFDLVQLFLNAGARKLMKGSMYDQVLEEAKKQRYAVVSLLEAATGAESASSNGQIG